MIVCRDRLGWLFFVFPKKLAPNVIDGGTLVQLTLDTADILGVREALILTPFPMVALFPVLLVVHFS